jgi:transposase
MQYPADLRDVVVRRILAHKISAKEAVDEYGVAHSTVYHWVSRARKQAASHDGAALTPSDMKKLPLPEGVPLLKMIQADAVCRHFGYDSVEAGEYCRGVGLHLDDVRSFSKQLKDDSIEDAAVSHSRERTLKSQATKDKAKIKEAEKQNRLLQKKIDRKDKALAETTALLVLSKKAEAIWGVKES